MPIQNMSSNVMSLEDAVVEALEGSAESRIKVVVRILEKSGATSADDLRYFNWKSLKELGGLSDMEINKIMRFLSKYYPQEYEEHKKIKSAEDELLRKKELIEYSNKLQIQIHQDRLRFQEELRSKENLDGQTHSPQAVVVQEPRSRVNSDQHQRDNASSECCDCCPCERLYFFKVLCCCCCPCCKRKDSGMIRRDN